MLNYCPPTPTLTEVKSKANDIEFSGKSKGWTKVADESRRCGLTMLLPFLSSFSS